MTIYPSVEDAVWIRDLTLESDFSYVNPSLNEVKIWIENKTVLIDDTDHAFIFWSEKDGYVNINLALTDPAARNQGLSMTLFAYVWNMFRCPIRYTVLKDSKAEYYTSLRDKYVRNRCTLLREFDVNGKTYREYEAVDERWK